MKTINRLFKLLLFAFIIVMGNQLNAQELLFEKRFALSGNYNGIENIKQTNDGGYLCVVWNLNLANSAIKQLSLLRLDANGDSLFVKPLAQHKAMVTYFDRVQFTDNNEIIVAINRHDEATPAGANDIEIMLFDSTGALIKNKYFRRDKLVRARGIRPTPDGGFVLTGVVATDTSLQNAKALLLLAKLDANLDTVFTRTYYTISYGIDVIPLNTGGYAIASELPVKVDSAFYISDILVVGTDANGDSLWSKQFGYTIHRETTEGLGQLENSNIILVGGGIDSSNAGQQGIHVISLDYQGNLNFEKYIGELFGNQYGFKFTETDDGGIIIVGSDVTVNIEYDYLIKIDGQGNLVWKTQFIIDDINEGAGLRDITKTRDGNYIAAGLFTDLVTNEYEAYVVKFKDTLMISSASFEQALVPVKVYPTLTNQLSNIKVELPTNETFTLEVFDLKGQLLWTKEKASGTVTLGNVNTTPGQYLVRATGISIRFTHKVVVQ